MVISIVALIAALTGTAFAGGFVTKMKVNKIITNRAPGLSVSHAKTADSATTATNAGKATTADSATNATTATSAKNVLWAVVSDTGVGGAATLVRSNVPGATVSDGTGVNVNLGQNVTGCAWIATKGDPGTSVETAGYAQTQQADGAAPNAVNVRTRDPGGTLDELDFHLLVVC